MATDVDVAIIGAGLAGIAAALSARKAGAKVVVLEASAKAGGKAQTQDGCERGPQSFNARHGVFWELLEGLGLTPDAVSLPAEAKKRYLARGGKLRLAGPFSGAIKATELFNVVADGVRTRDVVSEGQSIHAFFTERFGASFADGPAAAMISGIFAGDVRALSIEACFPELIAAAKAKRSVVRGMASLAPKGETRKGLFTLNGGFGRIGEAAEKQLPIQLSSPVSALVRNGDGFTIQSKETWNARAVVVATEAPAAAKLLWPLSPDLGAALGALEYLPLSVVHWKSSTARMPPGFGYLACPSENLFALGTMFRGSHFSTFVRGVEQDDAALLAGVSRDVEKLTGGSVESVIRVDRWPNAVFQPTLAIASTRAKLKPLADSAGVILAGSYLGASAMKDALATGLSAGRAAHASVQERPEWSRSLS